MGRWGRNAGWIAAASALARQKSGSGGPHLIYLPERPFSMEHFLEDVAECHRKYGGVLVVCSEGLTGPDGGALWFRRCSRSGRSVYPESGWYASGEYGHEGELGLRKPLRKTGTLRRTSIRWRSEVGRSGG